VGADGDVVIGSMAVSDTDAHRAIEAVWRLESARIIAGLARLVRDVDLAEELAQDALVAALEQWPSEGIPPNPGAWLTVIAKRRAIDRLRRLERLERKQEQIEATIAQRIVRAKRTLGKNQIPFELPAPTERAERLASVLEVIYLIFNEGYAATGARTGRVRSCATRRCVLAGSSPRSRRMTPRSTGWLRSWRSRRHGCAPASGRPANRFRCSRKTVGAGTGCSSCADSPLCCARSRSGDRPALMYFRQPSRRATPVLRHLRTPTGHRSQRSRTCSAGSRPRQWSASTARSPYRWHPGLRKG
jgi:DNA-directed RNA polymerase specialized sigma24 family protein